MTNTLCTKNQDMVLNLIDLDRFPISNLDESKGAKFLQECQDHMDAHGWCNLMVSSKWMRLAH